MRSCYHRVEFIVSSASLQYHASSSLYYTLIDGGDKSNPSDIKTPYFAEAVEEKAVE